MPDTIRKEYSFPNLPLGLDLDTRNYLLASEEIIRELSIGSARLLGQESGTLDVSAFMETVLDDVTAPAARATLLLEDYSATLKLADVITKSPWVDVRAYGAVGDGVTDDTTAIQAALDNGSVKTVLIPDGTYLISATLTLDTGIHLIISRGATITLDDDSDVDMIQNSDASNGNNSITISGDGVIDGNGDNQGVVTDAIQFTKCDRTTIRDIEIDDMSGIGINIQGSASNRLHIHDTRIHDCVSHGINFNGIAGLEGSLVNSNIIYTCGQNGIALQGGTKRIVVRGNICYNNGTVNGNGIYVGEASENLIIGNRCYKNSIDALSGSGIGLNNAAGTHEHNQIVGNFCMLNGDDGIDVVLGASADHNRFDLITGNYCLWNTNSGINVMTAHATDGPTGHTITGNHCSLNGYHGINLNSDFLTSTTRGHTVTGNTCISNSQTSSLGSSGIYILDQSYCTVSGNYVMNSGSYANKQNGIIESGTSNYNTITGNSIDLAGSGIPLQILGNETQVGLNGVGSDETVTTGSPTLQSWGFTKIDSSGGAITGTLGSGSFIGQIKTIVMTDATTSSTVSATNHETSDPEVATFDAVDETWILMWTGTEWITIKATCTFL